MEGALKNLIRVMKALSDANRLKIMKMLQCKELCVCEVKDALDITQPTVSKHLKILEGAGLVSSRKDGLWVYYRISSGKSSPYAATLLGNLKHWLDRDPEIADILEKLALSGNNKRRANTQQRKISSTKRLA